jgi:hypothetical protein
MRKTLLIAAAALAASVISSEAQVYSQNIVGYVNTPIPTGFVVLANPLDASDPSGSGVNNSITNALPVFSTAYDGQQVYYYNGHGYSTFTIDSSWPTGLGNAADSAQAPAQPLPPGVGIFINNNSGVAETNTFVGTVHVDGAATGVQVVGSTTNGIPTGYTFVSSKLPIGGGLTTVLGLSSDASLDGAQVYFPNITGSPGAVHGYQTLTIDSSWPTKYGNAADSAQAAEPVLPVGGGFLINNNTGGALNWVQQL